MIASARSYQQGFTAVELLIALVIASVFLFAGYQLYIQVMSEGATVNRMARLSNATYAQLRTSTANADTTYPSGCNFSTPATTTTTQSITGLGTITFTTTISCPYVSSSGSAQNLFSIRVDASSDGGATTEISHATFAN